MSQREGPESAGERERGHTDPLCHYDFERRKA